MPQPPPRIAVRVDANHAIGAGHGVRTAALLAALATPHAATVIGRGALLAELFPAVELRLLDGAEGEGGAAGLGLIRDCRPDLVLVDHPALGPGFWTGLRAECRAPVAAIDDVGGDLRADLVINGTVLEEYHRYPALEPGATVLAGGAYALIRPDFAATPWRDPAAAGVIIVVGSGDRAQDWALWLASDDCDRCGWGRVGMIVRPSFPALDELRRRCRDRGIALAAGLPGPALAAASVALITGGMVVYEALAVGVPAVVFPQIENLIPEARWFAARGCILDLGFDGGMDPGRVGAAVGRLLADPEARRAMSARQRAIIDGRGLERAARAVDRLIERGAAPHPAGA